MFYLVTSWRQGPRLSLAGPHRHTDSTLKWSALSESKCLSDTFQPPVSDDVVGLTFNGPVSAWYMRITGYLTCNCTKLMIFLQLHSISGGVKWAGGQRRRREKGKRGSQMCPLIIYKLPSNMWGRADVEMCQSMLITLSHEINFFVCEVTEEKRKEEMEDGTPQPQMDLNAPSLTPLVTLKIPSWKLIISGIIFKTISCIYVDTAVSTIHLLLLAN